MEAGLGEDEDGLVCRRSCVHAQHLRESREGRLNEGQE